MNEDLIKKEKKPRHFINGILFLLIGFVLILFMSFLNNYFQEKDNTRKEIFAVQEIAVEIEYYKFIQESGSKKMNDVIDATDRLLNTIRNSKNKYSDAEIELDLHKITWLFLAGTPTTKYTTLDASGNFEYISSSNLRHSLLQYHADVEKLVQFEEIQVRYVDLVLRPFLNKNMDRISMEANTFVPNLDSVVIKRYPSPFTYNINDLINNREFANILVDLKFHTRRLMFPYNRIGKGINHLQDLITKDYPSVSLKSYEPF